MSRGLKILVLIFVSSLFCIKPAAAVTLPYAAEVTSGAVTMATDQIKLVTLKFKNVGTKTWIAGQDKVAVYLYGSSSVLSHTTWLRKDLPAVIEPASVPPGQMASASFYVKAPSTVGEYQERFLLSYGSNLWIKGSVVPVTFTVTKPALYNYQAELVDKSVLAVKMQSGVQTTVDVKLKNTGKKTWYSTGANFISFYTWNPKYRTSVFKDASWKSSSQTGTLVEKEVPSGQVGTVRVKFTAPATALGRYEEALALAAEDMAWIRDGELTFVITVEAKTQTATPVATSTMANPVVVPAPSAAGSSYQATLLLNSFRESFRVVGNERIAITQGFKNAGTLVWNVRSIKLLSVAPSLGAASDVYDGSWPSRTEVVRVAAPIAPGELGFVNYTFKAPAKSGNYVIKFQLTADEQSIEGGEVEIPVTVTADGYVSSVPIPVDGPVVTGPLPLTGDLATLPAEPIMRVGVFETTDDTMLVRGIQGGMKVVNNGEVVCHIPQNQEVTVRYVRASAVYKVSGTSCTSQSTTWYVLEAEDGLAPLEITDFNRPIDWLPGSNDNKFRAKLELRFTPATDKVWVINELLLEQYLYGIAETSDVSPLEYQKALLAAARTYALYHVNRGTKHANEFFHVDAKYDQVYRGYGQEARSPNIVQGVKQTFGQIVTYDGKLAITPYFSRSDGRTRNWTEVWGGSGFPWLVSVPVTWDEGQTLWGHGVGLSARGALYMASKDGATYDTILKHFYRGIELRQAYK
jgi:hypothetical protein